MKKFILLSVIVLAFISWVQAQTALRVEPSIVSKQVVIDQNDRNYEDVSKVTVRNTTDRILQLRWDRVVINMPDGWEVNVCENLVSYPPFRKANAAANAPAPIELAPGETFDLYLTVKPYGQYGEASIEVPLSLITNPSQPIQTAAFNIRVDNDRQRSVEISPARPTVTQPRIYPNPATDRFYVSLPRNVELGRVEIFNTLGRQVQAYERASSNEAFDISQLPEGVYLVSLYDLQGKPLRTLRLLHRSFRP